MSERYNSTGYCTHCERTTPHVREDGGHERDSSNDYEECLVCGWFKWGFMKDRVGPRLRPLDSAELGERFLAEGELKPAE